MSHYLYADTGVIPGISSLNERSYVSKRSMVINSYIIKYFNIINKIQFRKQYVVKPTSSGNIGMTYICVCISWQ